MGHSSISCIKQNSSIQRFPCGDEICLTTPNEILKFLKEKRTKNTAHVLCSPLSKAINNSLLQGAFPDDAKISFLKYF